MGNNKRNPYPPPNRTHTAPAGSRFIPTRRAFLYTSMPPVVCLVLPVLPLIYTHLSSLPGESPSTRRRPGTGPETHSALVSAEMTAHRRAGGAAGGGGPGRTVRRSRRSRTCHSSTASMRPRPYPSAICRAVRGNRMVSGTTNHVERSHPPNYDSHENLEIA